jgi:hypothetical protein
MSAIGMGRLGDGKTNRLRYSMGSGPFHQVDGRSKVHNKPAKPVTAVITRRSGKAR